MKLLLSIILLSASQLSFAACESPAVPALPDGSSATQEQMIAGQQAVKQFMSLNEAYLECLTQAAQKAVDTDSKEKKQARLDQYNLSVETMQTVASDFNLAIKAWKKANAK